MRITQKVNDVYNAKLLAYYFYVKTKISVGFQICISVHLMSVSFGTYKRRRRDVLMAPQGYVPLRRLDDVRLRRRWLFHLRLI